MNRRMLVVAAGMLFLFAAAILLVSQETTTAQDCRLVRVHGGALQSEKPIIEPQTAWIEKGTCVIWSNWVRTDEIKIVFEEGKKCEDMTDASMGFTMDAANCYVTTWVPLGGTSSLRFNEASSVPAFTMSQGISADKPSVSKFIGVYP